MAMSKQTITLIALIMASMMIVLPTKTEALVPCNKPLWDMMIIPIEDDPFKILEQIPFNLAKSIDTTIDLARADWKETSMHHVISIDVPGIKRGDIKVEVEENRVLKVSGERKLADEETNGDKWHKAERTSGKFCRQFKLPVNADMENITAHLEDGVLKIIVTKMAHERKQSKVIDIIEQGRSNDDVKTTKVTA